MGALRSLLLFALAINAAPTPVIVVETAVVTAVATSTATAAATTTANSKAVVFVKAQGSKAKQQNAAQKPMQPPKEHKYFHEPGWDTESGHYDARYFRGKVPYEQHRAVLRYLVRSYLTTFKTLGVETWLAHGSLLGWWWNGQIMPWDYDLDVQVSGETLSFLAERHNRSTHEYEYETYDAEEVVLLEMTTSEPVGNITRRSDEDNGSIGDDRSDDEGRPVTRITRTYLLDVNPHHASLAKGNGANVIDARWIDMSNGMFIDITGLRERDPMRSPGVWSCKNNHRYRTDELWPLRRTDFEGVEAWIPYAFDKVLTDEYGPKSLVTEEWAGHRWKPELREWVKLPKKETPKKQSPKKEQYILKEDENVVIVYEEVIVEV